MGIQDVLQFVWNKVSSTATEIVKPEESLFQEKCTDLFLGAVAGAGVGNACGIVATKVGESLEGCESMVNVGKFLVKDGRKYMLVAGTVGGFVAGACLNHRHPVIVKRLVVGVLSAIFFCNQEK